MSFQTPNCGFLAPKRAMLLLPYLDPFPFFLFVSFSSSFSILTLRYYASRLLCRLVRASRMPPEGSEMDGHASSEGILLPSLRSRVVLLPAMYQLSNRALSSTAGWSSAGQTDAD